MKFTNIFFKFTLGLMVGLIIVLMVRAEDYTIQEFKDLTDDQLLNWSFEYIETTYEAQDDVYHFEMDVYRYYQPTNTMRLEREPFSFSCHTQSTNCAVFYESQLLILQDSIFNEYKELQDEL